MDKCKRCRGVLPFMIPQINHEKYGVICYSCNEELRKEEVDKWLNRAIIKVWIMIGIVIVSIIVLKIVNSGG